MTRRLLVTSTFPQYPGDPRGEFLLRHAEALAREGLRVRVLAPRTAWTAGGVGGPVEVVRFPYAPRSLSSLTGRFGTLENLRERPGRAVLLPGFLLSLRRALARELRTFRPERVEGHFLLPCGPAVARACARSGTPFALHGHGTDVDLLLRLPRPLASLLTRQAQAAERLSFPSREKLERYRARHGGANLAVAAWGECVAAPAWSDPAPPVAGRVLFLGRLIPQKGVDVLLRAAARLGSSVQVVVAGEGPQAAHLRDLARRLGVAARFPGLVVGPAKERAFQQAQVVCVPSCPTRQGLSEGAPLVVVEALRRGVPVVASRLGGIPELAGGGDVTLVPPGDPAALARALSQVLSRRPEGAACASASC